MIGFCICNVSETYRGCGRMNELVNFLDTPNDDINRQTSDFICECIDYSTQKIIFSLENIIRAKNLLAQLAHYDYEAEIIIYADTPVDELPANGFKFIGYDVCGEDGFSPLAEKIIGGEKNEQHNYFYGYADTDTLKKLEKSLNKCVLFDDVKHADMLAKICNGVAEKYDDAFYGEKQFKSVLIYAEKSL